MQKNTHKVLNSQNKILFTGTKHTCVEFVNNNVWADGTDISAVLPLTQSETEVYNQWETDEQKEICFQACLSINPVNPENAANAYDKVLAALKELYNSISLEKDGGNLPELTRAAEAIELATK